MDEIVKHINDTNASYRAINAGDAKNTDLFLDNEHYELFKDSGEQITVRFNKENLQKAILFIASILPRKYDNSATHKVIRFSSTFVFDQLAFLDAFFTIDGATVETRTQLWDARKDIPKKNGEIDKRFYFNGLLEDVPYTNFNGEKKIGKFTIRNYVAGGYSDLHIKKTSDGIYDVWITNTQTPYDDGKDKHLEITDDQSLSLQQIFYGAPGTGKSNTIKREVDDKGLPNVRTTFHPDSDYSTFVGAYKPTSVEVPVMTIIGKEQVPVENAKPEKKIVYEFVPQAFLKAYTGAWKNQDRPFFLIIEEINRGNCAQIFGDLFQLLDRKNGESEYPISPDEDIQKFLRTDKKYGFASLTDEQKAAIPEDVLTGEMMILPKNLYIWSTMNTSDQSLFPIDSAFKRRWDWKYVPIANANKNWRIKADGLLFDWWDFLEKVNAVIGTTTNSEDKKLGYFFCKPAGRIIDAETFVGKVVFYLWNDVFKDFEFEGDVFKDVDGKLSFNKFYDVNDQGDTVIKEDKVVLFLNNLGVEEIEDDIDYSSEGNDIDKDGSFSVRYDGEPIEGKSAIDIFATVIEAAGVGRIAEMGLAVGGHPLLSKDKLDENVMGGYGKGQRKIGDYWMITKFSNSQKKTFLNKIKAQFDLNIEID